MDDVAIWNTAFTASQMQALAQGRSPLTPNSLDRNQRQDGNVQRQFVGLRAGSLYGVVARRRAVAAIEHEVRRRVCRLAERRGDRPPQRSDDARLQFDGDGRSIAKRRSDGRRNRVDHRRRAVAFRHEYLGDSRADHRANRRGHSSFCRSCSKSNSSPTTTCSRRRRAATIAMEFSDSRPTRNSASIAASSTLLSA